MKWKFVSIVFFLFSVVVASAVALHLFITLCMHVLVRKCGDGVVNVSYG